MKVKCLGCGQEWVWYPHANSIGEVLVIPWCHECSKGDAPMPPPFSITA